MSEHRFSNQLTLQETAEDMGKQAMKRVQPLIESAWVDGSQVSNQLKNS